MQLVELENKTYQNVVCDNKFASKHKFVFCTLQKVSEAHFEISL